MWTPTLNSRNEHKIKKQLFDEPFCLWVDKGSIWADFGMHNTGSSDNFMQAALLQLQTQESQFSEEKEEKAQKESPQWKWKMISI